MSAAHMGMVFAADGLDGSEKRPADDTVQRTTRIHLPFPAARAVIR